MKRGSRGRDRELQEERAGFRKRKHRGEDSFVFIQFHYVFSVYWDSVLMLECENWKLLHILIESEFVCMHFILDS